MIMVMAPQLMPSQLNYRFTKVSINISLFLNLLDNIFLHGMGSSSSEAMQGETVKCLSVWSSFFWQLSVKMPKKVILKRHSIFWFSFTKKNWNILFPTMKHIFSVLGKRTEMEKEKRWRERERRMGVYVTF